MHRPPFARQRIAVHHDRRAALVATRHSMPPTGRHARAEAGPPGTARAYLRAGDEARTHHRTIPRSRHSNPIR